MRPRGRCSVLLPAVPGEPRGFGGASAVPPLSKVTRSGVSKHWQLATAQAGPCPGGLARPLRRRGRSQPLHLSPASIICN